MITIEQRTIEGEVAHCLFCGAQSYDLSVDQAVVVRHGDPVGDWRDHDSIAVICRDCLQRDAAGRAALVGQLASRLREQARVLDALAAAVREVPDADWLRLVGAVLRVPRFVDKAALPLF